MGLADNLAALIKAKGLDFSENQLARETRVPQPQIHRIASGATRNPGIFTLKPIARYFGLTVDELCSDRLPGKQSNVDDATIADATRWRTLSSEAQELAQDYMRLDKSQQRLLREQSLIQKALLESARAKAPKRPRKKSLASGQP